MLPSGWKKLPLSQIAEVRTGLAVGKKGLLDPVRLPYLRVANVQDGRLDLEEVKFILVERRQVERYSLKYGDILMTEGGDFDKLGRGDVWHGQIEPCLHQNHIFAVRPKVDLADSSFLSALAASKYGRNYFLSCAKRSTNLASINSAQLKAFPVLLPSLSEQRGIAKILFTWDKAIAITERLEASTRLQKRILIAALLSGKRRVRGCNASWQDVALKDICTFHKGGGIAKIDLVTNGAQPCILYGELFTTYGEVIRQVVSTTNSTQGFHGNCGDVLIPTATTTVAEDLAKASALLVNDVSIGGDAIVLRPNTERVTSEFLAYTLSYSKKKEIAARAQGATIVHLSVGDLSHLRIALPPKQEQIAICQIFEELNRQLELLQLDVQKLKQEKAVLMTQLLTGKRRVHLPEAGMEMMA